MADPNMSNNSNNSNNANQTMQREQAKAEVGGGSDRQREQGGMDKDREKSAIGGQDKSDDMSKSDTGESGRARNELDQNRGEQDKSRSEPTGQR